MTEWPTIADRIEIEWQKDEVMRDVHAEMGIYDPPAGGVYYWSYLSECTDFLKRWPPGWSVQRQLREHRFQT